MFVSIESYRCTLLENTLVDNSWIKVDEKYCSVSTKVLEWLEFFRNLLTDITIVEYYDNKPVILSIKTTDLEFVSIELFKYMHESIRIDICTLETFTNSYNNCDSNINQTNYILLLNHFTTIPETKRLMEDIDMLPNTYLDLINYSFIRWQSFFPPRCGEMIIKNIIENKITDIQYIQDICKFYDIPMDTCHNLTPIMNRLNSCAIYDTENKSFYSIYCIESINHYFLINKYVIPQGFVIHYNKTICLMHMVKSNNNRHQSITGRYGRLKSKLNFIDKLIDDIVNQSEILMITYEIKHGPKNYVIVSYNSFQ